MTTAASQLAFRTRPQAWRAYKGILREISSRGLVKGARLPNQPELRAALGVSNDTLHAVIEHMTASGIVTSRPRHGTVVADPHALANVPWNIGITVGRVEDERPLTFYAELLMRLQASLGRAGCRCVIYPRTTRHLPCPIGEVTSLREDLETGAIDGLLALAEMRTDEWQWILQQGIPVCHTHVWESAPCGVLIDQGAMAENAVATLVQRGCRKLAAAALVDREILHTRFWDGFDRGVARAGLPAAKSLSAGASYSRPEQMDMIATQLANGLLGLPANERPDGIVIGDDYIAEQFVALLHAGGYRPQVAVQTNRQQPRHFALPVIPFEVDIHELAQQTTALLLERVCNPAAPERVEWLAPRHAHASTRSEQLVTVG